MRINALARIIGSPPTTPNGLLTEVTPVVEAAEGEQILYTFNSQYAGVAIYGGSTQSETVEIVAGNNTIEFDPLAIGTYTDVTIQVLSKQGWYYTLSNVLAVSSFEIVLPFPDDMVPDWEAEGFASAPSLHYLPSKAFKDPVTGNLISWRNTGAAGSAYDILPSGGNPEIDQSHGFGEVPLVQQAFRSVKILDKNTNLVVNAGGYPTQVTGPTRATNGSTIFIVYNTYDGDSGFLVHQLEGPASASQGLSEIFHQHNVLGQEMMCSRGAGELKGNYHSQPYLHFPGALFDVGYVLGGNEAKYDRCWLNPYNGGYGGCGAWNTESNHANDYWRWNFWGTYTLAGPVIDGPHHLPGEHDTSTGNPAVYSLPGDLDWFSIRSNGNRGRHRTNWGTRNDEAFHIPTRVYSWEPLPSWQSTPGAVPPLQNLNAFTKFKGIGDFRNYNNSLKANIFEIIVFGGVHSDSLDNGLGDTEYAKVVAYLNAKYGAYMPS